MKLDEALEVLKETSNLDLEIRRKQDLIDRSVDQLALFFVGKAFLEQKRKFAETGDNPEEVHKKAAAATKNIFKSAAREKSVGELVKKLNASIKQSVGIIR